MANRAILEKEIKEYCVINNIKDISGFITQCLLQGFNIYKYGNSPQDNKEKEKQEFKVSNKEKKTKLNIDKENIEENTVVTKNKRKIKITQVT